MGGLNNVSVAMRFRHSKTIPSGGGLLPVLVCFPHQFSSSVLAIAIFGNYNL